MIPLLAICYLLLCLGIEMDIRELWEKALGETQILRPRIKDLQAFSSTQLPYLLLCASSVNAGNTLVRKGEVVVEKPSLIVPVNSPQFEGFDFDKDPQINQDILTNFLIIRGVRFPSLKYNNKTASLDIYEGDLEKAVSYYSDMLARQEDVDTGLVSGPDDCWQFSLLIFICSQVVRSTDSDISKIIDEFRKRRKRKRKP